jgi:hypothetical protein
VPIAKKEIPVLPEYLLFTASDYQIGIYSKFSSISSKTVMVSKTISVYTVPGSRNGPV